MLGGRLLEEVLAVGLDRFLMLFADLGWISDALVLVITLHQLLGSLQSMSDSVQKSLWS